MTIGGIDLFIVVAYLVAIPIFGVYFKKYVKTEEDYFLAGRMLPWWVISMSIIGTNIGAYDYMGAAGGAYRFGIAQANYEWIGALPAMVLSALLFVPYYWKAGVYTVPEFLGRRYNLAVRVIQALLWGLFLACVLGVFFWAAGLMLNEYLGIPVWVSLLVTAVIVGVYTITGGLAAVAMTDVVQLLVMFIGGVALTVLGLWTVGGWSGLVASITPTHPNHFKLFLPLDDPTIPWLGMILGLAFVLSPAWWCCHQAIIQRTLGARSEWDAKAGMMFAAFPKMLIPVLVVLPGLLALSLNPDLVGPDMDRAFPWLIRNLLPAGLAGLVFAAFMAALISSVDSTLNSAATVWTRDIYQRFLVRNASDRHYLRVGRILTLVFVLWAIAFAPVTQQFPGIYVAMQSLLSIFQGPTFAITLLGIGWSRATQWGGLFGLLAGVAISSTLYFAAGWSFLYVAWWSFVGALVVNVVVSLLTKPEPTSKLEGLVYGLVMKNGEIQDVLSRRADGGE
ncbi:MAG: sodium/solute symporter [Gemmatimonadales bacterium]|nr:sodium/solute symporter [Gemmatimonadales bacterium]NIN11368.1 sodium/solute symporter [Gemmatimonadales bacterium]NIN49977.1 sodium/solute symporter [Gemmatimonadales bacterium]NIP07441.1 sodium/solute symporter [Gemmatimonadales bacterium]NIR00509.1 sodium/solute symporter [Gemmatimonadales bacterium]